MKTPFRLIPILFVFLFACSQHGATSSNTLSNHPGGTIMSDAKLETATLGGGCFWCTEAVYQRLKGVKKVVSGYSGGFVDKPTYRQVCDGNTGHAEVVQISFDPKEVSFSEILDVFWKTHDPTTLNRQGNDEGPQYRSAIFYHNDKQKVEAEESRKKAAGHFDRAIVTEITAFTQFFPAEDYHQNYYNQNGGQSYCAFVIRPKVEKFEKTFKDKLQK